MACVYTDIDITRIKDMGFSIELPPSTIEMISYISEKVGAPTYVKTPTFAKVSRKKRVNVSAPFTGSAFTKTEGIDRNMAHIRGHLNKLSANNYDKIAPVICENIQLLLDNDVTPEELSKVANFVFDTASSNRFYSDMYADLYTELTLRFPIFRTIFDNSFGSYSKLYDDITSFSESDNFDDFCKQTEVNSARRAFTAFIVNLTIKKQIENNVLFDLCWKLQSCFDSNILVADKQPLCDELCENIFIIMTEGYECLRTEGRYASLNGKMTIIKNTKVKDVKSLTNKSLFKYYDMFDYVEKLGK